MNLINTPKTMSSREIARLVESRHDSVKRTISRLMESNTIQPTPLVEVKNEQGQTVSEYQIGKRDSYVVVAQLSPEFTARLVDRWQELESKQPALPDFSNPVEAARAWADAKESEQKLLLEAKENAPKIEFYEQVTGSTDTVDMAQAAKVLNMGIGRNKLFELLRDKKVLQHNNQPYQTYIDRGYFRMVESKFQKPTGDTHISIKTVVYQKGLDYIRKLIKESKK